MHLLAQYQSAKSHEDDASSCLPAFLFTFGTVRGYLCTFAAMLETLAKSVC